MCGGLAGSERRAGLLFLLAPSALRRGSGSWQAEAAIRGRWRRAQGEGSVARRRSPDANPRQIRRPALRGAASEAQARRSSWLAASLRARGAG